MSVKSYRSGCLGRAFVDGTDENRADRRQRPMTPWPCGMRRRVRAQTSGSASPELTAAAERARDDPTGGLGGAAAAGPSVTVRPGRRQAPILRGLAGWARGVLDGHDRAPRPTRSWPVLIKCAEPEALAMESKLPPIPRPEQRRRGGSSSPPQHTRGRNRASVQIRVPARIAACEPNTPGSPSQGTWLSSLQFVEGGASSDSGAVVD